MIEERAKVVDTRGDRLVLQAQTKSACGSCAASKGCGTSVLSKVVGRKFTRFHATNSIDARVGDTVIVGISENALVKGSMMIYIVPLIGMLVFALTAEFYLDAAVEYRDLVIAASGLSGLVSGSLVAKWYFRRHSSMQRFSPVVLRKIIANE